MTDPAALTDEELAEMRAKLYHRPTCRNQPWHDNGECSCGTWDRFDRLIVALRASRAEVKRLREALDFYANPEHWESTLVASEWEANARASEWQSGATIDGGERARRALNVPLP